MVYRPSKYGGSDDVWALARYVEDELRSIERSQLDDIIALETRPTHVEPTRPRTGMIAYADGSDWNPGSGQGPYHYTGTNWLPMMTGSAVTSFDRLIFSDSTPSFDRPTAFGNMGFNILHNATSLSLIGSSNVASAEIFYFNRISLDSGNFIPVTVGQNGVLAGTGAYIEAQAASHSTSAIYSYITTVANKGPGGAKAVYGRGTAQTGCTGVVVGLVGAVDGTASQVGAPGAAAWCCQLDYSQGPDDLGVHIALDSSLGARVNAGITPIQPIKYNGPAYRAWMHTASSSAGARAYQLLDESTNELFYVKKDGQVVASNGLIAGFESNGLQLSLAALTRTSSLGNIAIVAGTASTANIAFFASNQAQAQLFGDRLELGVESSLDGKLKFFNTASGSITVQAQAGALGSSVITLPATTGTLGVAPASTTDDALARYNGTAGALQNSNATLLDSGLLTVSSLSVSNGASLLGPVTASSLTVSNATSLLGAVTASSLIVSNGATVSSLTVSNTTSLLGAVTASSLTVSNTAGFLGLINATGGQIQFPATQNPSASVNVLDDYEEGTFTPVLSFGGTSTGITYSTQSGTYTKVGNRVFGEVSIILTSKGSSTGQAIIAGLPFTAGMTAVTAMHVNQMDTSLAVPPTCPIGAGSTVFTPAKMSSGSAVTLAETDFANTSIVRISFHYQV